MAVANPYSDQLDRVPVRTGETRVRGSVTRYWDYGPADAPLTMVVVHGYRGEHHGLEPVIAQLEGLRIISPDLPGFGESTPLAADDGIPGYAAWLREFLDALGLDAPPVVLGHSFGSIVVSHAVAGGLVAPRVVLVNPIAAPALKGPKAVVTLLTLAFYRLSGVLPESWGDRLLRSPLIVQFMSSSMVTTKDRSLRRWVHDQHHTYFSRYSSRDSVVAGFEASISANVGEVATSLTMPTLLVAGSVDPITSQKDLRVLAERLPDARLVVLDGVGHLIHYERPREAASAIVEFLGSGRVVEPHA